MKTTLLFVALALVLSGCTGTVGHLATPTAQENDQSSTTVAPVVPTPTPAPSSSSGWWSIIKNGGTTATPTPNPGATPTPSPTPTTGATATPAPGSTATPAPGATPTPTPTYTDTGGTMTQTSSMITSTIPTSEEILPSMVSALGTGSPSTASYTVFSTYRPIFSEDGTADSVTPPMAMSVLNLGGQVCDDLILAEAKLAATNRRLFPQWNFSAGPASLTTAAINDSIRRFARQVWARNETDAERALIATALTTNFTGANVADTKGAAMMLCVATVGSLKGIKR